MMGFLLGMAFGVFVGLRLPSLVVPAYKRALRACLYRCRRKPRHLWRAGAKSWQAELAEPGLDFLPGPCSNCQWWDCQGSRPEEASRLHSAMDHVYFTGNGCRWEGSVESDMPDRWMSTTPSAAVLIWRTLGQSSVTVHSIQLDESADPQDLRYLILEAPALLDQCLACGDAARRDSCTRVLPEDSAFYCMRWGIWLQEVLLDRCCRLHSVKTRLISAADIPDWASDLATAVVMRCYRRHAGQTPEVGWLDVWAMVQEWRLERMLRTVMRKVT